MKNRGVAAFTVVSLVAVMAVSLITHAASGAAGVVRVLLVGDSLVAQNLIQPELDTLLTNNGVNHVLESEGWPGKSCFWLAGQMSAFLAAHQSDLVIIMCGTNDRAYYLYNGEPEAAFATRYMIETIHSYRPANPILVTPTLVGYVDPFIWPGIPDQLAAVNDILWSNQRLYYPPRVPQYSWLTDTADLQWQQPDTDRLDSTGVHLRPKGAKVVAALLYHAASAAKGWPAIPVPPCLLGHRPGTPQPTNLPPCLT